MNPFVSLDSRIGERIDFTSRAVAATTSGYTANASPLVTLTKGNWILFPVMSGTAVASLTAIRGFMSSNSNNDSSGIIGIGHAFVTIANSTLTQQMPMLTEVLNVTVDSMPIYAKAGTTGANATITIAGFAIRIA